MVIAIGQSPSPIISRTTPELSMGQRGVVVVDPATMKTSKKGYSRVATSSPEAQPSSRQWVRRRSPQKPWTNIWKAVCGSA